MHSRVASGGCFTDKRDEVRSEEKESSVLSVDGGVLRLVSPCLRMLVHLPLHLWPCDLAGTYSRYGTTTRYYLIQYTVCTTILYHTVCTVRKNGDDVIEM